MDPNICTQDLTRTYDGTAVVDGVTLTVRRGRVCALLGHNGAGKTTLVRMLSTLTRPTSGIASIAGHDVVTQPDAVRRHTALVGQAASVDERLSGRDNLVLFARLRGRDKASATARAGELLERFGLSDAAGRPVRTYSGGMRRKLDLAAALVDDPTVLFVDEPSTGLDPRARRDLWHDLRAFADAGTTILLTTQHLEEADALADDVVILRQGRVVAAGTIGEIRRLAGEPRMELREPSLEDVYLTLTATEVTA